MKSICRGEPTFRRKVGRPSGVERALAQLGEHRLVCVPRSELRLAFSGSIAWRPQAVVLGQNLRITFQSAQVSGYPSQLITPG
jgi:hypothetical protein